MHPLRQQGCRGATGGTGCGFFLRFPRPVHLKVISGMVVPFSQKSYSEEGV
jgi:hypothetical protein